MKSSSLLPAFLLALGLASCEKPAPPAVQFPAPVQDDAQLTAARDALARQAIEIETRSALLDKQLAELEEKLRQSENEALRGQLDGLKQQNEQLRSQADAARRQSESLDRRLAATAPPPVPVLPPQAAPRDYAVFHERLAPHGRWIDVSGYGLCFQPRLARGTWRPYLDGCWSWSSLGWAWQSNEPFGWATYHYGRWINLSRHGWLWVPGCEWAPAWVAWRQSRDYIGWAPLPPEPGPCSSIQRDCDSRYNLGPASYTFISVTNFVRPTYTTICRPVSYNSTIFHHTVNSTQIVPCGGASATPLYMQHGGPPRHQMEQAARQPVPQIQIRSVDTAALATLTTPEPGLHGKLPAAAIIEIPAADHTHPKLPDIKPAEHIERPQLADTFAGVSQAARIEIQKGIEAEKQHLQIADTPKPLAGAPASPPAATAETILPAETVPQPVMTLGEPVVATASLPSLSAPIETRGTHPPLDTPATISPSAEPTAIATSATLHETAPANTSVSSIPSVPAPETSTAITPVSSVPSAPAPETSTAITSVSSVPSVSAHDTAPSTPVTQEATTQQAEAAAAEQARQAQAEAQRQTEEAARRAQEEAMRQAQAEAQHQAEETARRAQEEAMRQAQAEAQRQAEEAARRAQEEAMRQAQAEAQRQAEEAARRAQEEAMRQAQAEAQRQAEEAARRAQEEAMRQAQAEAQRQAEEAARAAAEAAARPAPPP